LYIFHDFIVAQSSRPLPPRRTALHRLNGLFFLWIC
jgi:hypothetical protein